MHKVLNQYGLNRRIANTTLRDPFFSLHRHYRTRRSHGSVKRVKEEEDKRAVKSASIQILVEHGEFRGFPSLDGIDNKHQGGHGRPATSSSDTSSRPSVKTTAVEETSSTPSVKAQSQGPSSAEPTWKQLKADKEGQAVSSQPQWSPSWYMRRFVRPKRFRPLAREVKSLRQHKLRLDPSAKKPLSHPFRAYVSTETLEAELRWISRTSPHPKSMRNVLQILVQDRKMKPGPAYYEALILGNCFPEFGSVDNVKLTLREMEREGIPLEPGVLLAVLTVLSVHPDTRLRATILSRLEQQQFRIPDLYTQLNILALIRENQLELATVELENLSRRAAPVPGWLWIIYIHALCDLRSDFGALLQLLYKLSDSGFLFPRPTLLHLLLKASSAGDLDLTKFIWHGYVAGMHIIPNEEICMDVLRLAAKQNDLKLAESVAVVLESVAGNTTTTPPSLVDRPPPSRKEMYHLDFDEPDLLDSPYRHEPPAPISRNTAENDANSDPEPKRSIDLANPSCNNSDPDLDSDPDHFATTLSTPPNLPSASSIPPRPLPAEALEILSTFGISVDSLPSKTLRNRSNYQGIMYPLFREEAGLRGARFDPRLALMKGWEWRKK